MKSHKIISLFIVAVSAWVGFNAHAVTPGFAPASGDQIVNREFKFSIGASDSCNIDCLTLFVNGDTNPYPLGCKMPNPKCVGAEPAPALRSAKVTLPVWKESYNVFRLEMTSQPVGGIEKKVFDSADNKEVVDFDYHINAKTSHSIDFWINDNRDADYHDFHGILEGPSDIKFVVDYLSGAACADDGSGPAYLYQSTPSASFPLGINSAIFTLHAPAGIASTQRPLGAVDVFVPGASAQTGTVVSSRTLQPSDFKMATAEFNVHFFREKQYPSFQFRVCSFNGQLSFANLSHGYDPLKPYHYHAPEKPGIFPIDPNPNLTGNAQIQVDLSKPPVKAKSLNGIMLGYKPSPIPPFKPEWVNEHGEQALTPEEVAKLVKPLKLGLWRAGPAAGTDTKQNVSDYAYASGAPVSALLSVFWGASRVGPGRSWVCDLKGQAKNFPSPCEGPYYDSAHEEAWKNLVSKTDSSHVRFSDLWNEPTAGSGEMTWPLASTPQQLFETYVSSAQAIQELNKKGAGILLGTPGFVSYDRAYLVGLLDYAVAHHVDVNVIAWHEMTETEQNLSVIADHIQDVRNNVMPKYVGKLNIQEIQINETLGPNDTIFPGEQIGTLFFLDQGGADRAAKDGWADSYGNQMSRDGSINGLFVPPNQDYTKAYGKESWYKPRTSYWVYKTYADTLDQRVPCVTSNNNIKCFSGAMDPETKEAKVLIGYFGGRYTFPTAKVNIALNGIGKNLAPNGKVHVKLETIPNLGEAPFESLPQPFPEMDMVVTAGAINVSFPSMAIHEGGIITLSPPGAEGPVTAPSGNTIFTTKQTFQGNLGGLLGADAICKNTALAGGLTQNQTWTALLAGDGQSLDQRIQSNGPFYNSLFQKVANNTFALFNVTLLNSLSYDETGAAVSNSDQADTWTGSGVLGAAVKRTCENWTSSNSSNRGTIGISNEIDYWTTDNSNNSNGQTTNCSKSFHLYCISQ